MLKKNKRFWAGLLSLALIVTQFSATAAALEDDESITVGMSNEVDSGEIDETPSITVGESDEKDSLVKTITSWKFVDEENLSEGVLALPGVSLEHQADFDTVVSMLPTQINAVIEGEEDSSILGIPGWACPEFVLDEKLNYPVSGEFTFTAMLPDGYACEPLPTVKVLLGGANLYTNEYGGLTITGGTVTQETDGQIKLSNGTYEISGEWKGTLTGVDISNRKAVITVPDGVTANVTLNSVIINTSGTDYDYACAFAVEADGTANITLSGTNTLTSGKYRAGLEVPEKATVTISGSDGILNANSSDYGAGIGGGNRGAGGTIEISGGTVNANGGDYSAGIGGGSSGAGGTIEISGGTVNANGGSEGAGIGGGSSGAGGTIEISGGTVNANGGDGGAGIGGGVVGGSGDITIKGSANVTAIGGASNSIKIGGSPTTNGNILISENAVVKAIGNDGSGIGGGGGSGGGNGSGIGGGGGDNGVQHNVRVEITGGTVEATSTNGAGIGGGYNGDGGEITINGNAVVFAKSENAAHIGAGLGGKPGTQNKTEGVVFEGDTGKVYGNPELPGDVTIPNGSTLTVPDGSTLTVPDGVTLDNQGTIDNKGTIDNYGTITGKQPTGGTTNSASTTVVTFNGSDGNATTTAELGDTIQITATAQQRAINARASSAAVDLVDFYIGNVASGNKLGTETVSSDSSTKTATATLEIELTGDKGFAIGENTITADFGGADTLHLLDSVGTATLIVTATPKLSLKVEPQNTVTYPGKVTLTATLSSGYPNNSGKSIEFTAKGTKTSIFTATTGSTGEATTTANLSPGTYTIDASFAGDTYNKPADATQITGYTVNIGTQGALEINGLLSAYTYGDTAFKLSTSGGSGNGAVSYTSSNPSVASVSGNTVTIRKSGTFTITATKAGDGNYDSTSVTSGTVTVREATPNLTLTATGGETVHKPIVLTATATRVGVGAVPAGTVTFREGSTILAADVRLDGAGKATYTVNRPTVGSHDYSVEYSGQSGYYNRSNATNTVTVESADQTGFMIESPGAKTYGDGKFTLTTSGGQSTGEVEFSVPDGNGVLTVTSNGEVEIIGVGSVKVTATKAGDSDYNQATATLDIMVAPRDISNVIVSVKGSHIYSGKQIQPDFEVTDGTIAITKDDYTHQYDTNVDAGTDAGAIILTGQRNYTGSKTVKFDIEPRPLTDAVITLESGPFTYTGKAIEPAITSVEVDGISVPDTAFEVGYADNIKAGTATVTITAKADSNFSGTASTSFIIENVKNNSSGSTIISGGDGSSRDNDSSSDKETTKSQTVSEPKRSYKVKGNKINQTISRTDLRKLANSGKSLTLTSDKSSMVFKPAALKAILAAVPTSATNTTFNAAPADLGKFPDAAKLIGSRPVYDFSLSYKSNNKAVAVKVNLPAGSVSIGVNYTPTSAEITGNLFMVYVDDKGAVTWLNKSSYVNGKVLAEVSHFSTFGVAYKTPESVFTDIGNHSAKKDFEWAVARDLFPDTEKALFSPDSPITKGMLVTALGRLANINPDSYQTRSFTDVKADASYAPYAEWAVQKNIIKLTDKNLFSPDEPITRENLAVIMANYAKQTGYSLSTPAAAVTFTDNDKISTWAKKEVTTMQRAGIMKGKDGSRFEPQSNSTRGEVSAILRRFVEWMNDPTMQG